MAIEKANLERLTTIAHNPETRGHLIKFSMVGLKHREESTAKQPIPLETSVLLIPETWIDTDLYYSSELFFKYLL